MRAGRTLGNGARIAVPTHRRRLVLILGTALAVGLLAAPPAAAEPGDPEPSDPAPSSTPTEPPPTPEPTAPSVPSTPPVEESPPGQPPPAVEPAGQAPPFIEEINAASGGHESLAADAIRFSELVAANEEGLARLELEAEAAGDVYRLAEADLAEASAEADRTRLAAEQARRALREAQDALETFARDSYMHTNSELVTVMLLLDSHGPRDLIDRVGLLDLVADSRTEVLTRVLATRAASTLADVTAAAAVDANAAAQVDAQARLDESTAMLAQQQAILPALLAQYAVSEATLYSALVRLLGPQGAAEAYALYEQDQLSQHAAEAAARAAAYSGGPQLAGSWAAPVRGVLTSCFCMRWGTMHWGIDLAAPMYTPEYAVGNGTVVQAGPATGFGQAIYIQHDNGDVTVYGHMEVIEVIAGQRVSAGQEIAQLGSQGFSTGPHLHFEVHVGGINGPRVDPVLWLAQRGIFV